MKPSKPAPIIYVAIPLAIALAGLAAHRAIAQSTMIGQSIIQSISSLANHPMTVSMIQTGIIEPINQPNVLPVKDLPIGGLYAGDDRREAFTLTNTDVKGKIAGNIARVEVTQTFQNPYDKPLEAIYVFPLPDQAAVDDMEIQIGDRIIKGDIKKREEAKEIYERARQEGRTAGLLEQERDNIFTQSLANIKPGEQIKVTIRYTESLKFSKGDYEFVFPMVVGPRYIPGNAIDTKGNTMQVPDASRINPPVLKPSMRSGNDIKVSLEIEAGLPIRNLYSTSHRLDVRNNGEAIAVQLASGDNIPNKDLIVRYQVSGDRTQPTILTTNTEQGSHFATYVIPAVSYRRDEIVPKDVVFLMDTSGSQSGDPIAKSQELMRRFINGLNPNDTFTIIDFASTTRQLSSVPLANTPANRQKALNYINQIDANGGTELMNGINAVMKFPAVKDGRLRSVVLITDGYIGNDQQIIAEVQKKLKPGNRLYSFGVGSSVNRYILERLAEVGRGTSQVVRQDEPTQAVAEKFFREINNPVLTNIQVQWQGDGAAPEIYPQQLPDLFAEQPLVLFGKKGDRASGKLKITGVAAGGERFEQVLDVNFEQNSGNLGIAQLWGRAKIKSLMNQMFGGEVKSLVDAVTQTALSYRLLSQYTAFVAVSEEVRVNPNGDKITVQVPVELPEGVKYEGIFGSVAAESVAPSYAMPSAPAGIITRSAPMSAPRRSVADSNIAMPVPQNQVTNSNKPLQSGATPIAKSASAISIVSITGLGADTATANKAIADQLKLLQIAANLSGNLIFEVTIQNGRLVRIIFDDAASSLKDQATVEMIKRSLQNVVLTAPQQGKMQLTLKLN
ncbi:MAG: VIT domain-containing protein [Pseudanabaenaceae cyanobacterium bins.39]|nr:VIT domain-containing protein [Pseudanabaenaceae cyanobacterium bins.39]